MSIVRAFYHMLFYLVLVCPQLPTYALIEAYVRLYNTRSNTTLDILYDYHTKLSPEVSTWMSADYRSLEQWLCPTEYYLLTVLEKLNKHCPPGSIDIVWETYPGLAIDDYAPCFIVLGEYAIQRKFKNLTFICADTCRDTGVYSFYSKNYYNISRSTIDNPVPVQRDKINTLRQKSCTTFHMYENLKARVITTIKNELNKQHIFDRSTAGKVFHEITDLEMLSHILTSTKKRIILYAGGAHCNEIRKFLLRTGEYEEVFVETSKYDKDPGKELELSLLDKLTSPHFLDSGIGRTIRRCN